ncbi:hypothetical protein L1887_36384 [Cichorium endivia]|nr:hypothetical protein L1887_36384 [Cichorium endivia]
MSVCSDLQSTHITIRSPTDLSLSQPNDFDHNTEEQPIFFQSDSIVPSEDMIQWHFVFAFIDSHLLLSILPKLLSVSMQEFPNIDLFTGNTNASVITSSNFTIYNLQSPIGPI